MMTDQKCTVVSNTHNKNGKKLRNFFIREFPIEIIGTVVWVFTIIIIGVSTTALEFTIAVVVNSNNDYSKCPHYDIYQYSQREIPV